MILGGVCVDAGSNPSSQKKTGSCELTSKAWEAYGNRQYEQAISYAQQCIERCQSQAKQQQASLRDFAPVGQEERYPELNDVGTSYFLMGEIYRKQKQHKKALQAYAKVLEEFSFAQYWSQRGWYWKVAPTAQESIDRIKGKKIQTYEIVQEQERNSVPSLVLFDYGTQTIVSYEQYGKFENIGTKEYRYTPTDLKSLMQAVGEGIYPNASSVRKDPQYKQFMQEDKLFGNHWDFMNSLDPRLDFYRWAIASEEKGVKQYYTAIALENAGLIEHAIKAYYAVLVHFPGSVGWTFWNSPWYVGQAAIDSILYLTEHNPHLGIKLVDAYVQIKNGFNETIRDDEVIVNPGKLIRVPPSQVKRCAPAMEDMPIIKRIGKKNVQLVQYKNGHWQLRVDNKPFLIQGITYAPTPVGESPDENTLTNWMYADRNKNAKIDGPYDVWVDKNRNNIQDPDEPVVGDFQLMKDMGVNCIRIYHHPHQVNKQLLRELYQEYGIMVIMGDFIGMYAIGSGACWHPGTDYTDPTHRKSMKESIKKMVVEFKDEPYVLMWLLGNENNYGVANNAKKQPAAFYAFVDEMAKYIKEIDPAQRPVAIGNGDVLFLDVYGKTTKHIDVLGVNAYRGQKGFGYSFWKNVEDYTDRAVFLTEYGCPAFMGDRSLAQAEQAQAEYLAGGWNDIVFNSAGHPGVGNAIGGVLFQWVDEWWKAYEPYEHDTRKNWAGPFPDGWMYEEWLGLTGQGNGTQSPFCRVLRKAYFTHQQLWNNNTTTEHVQSEKK